MIKMKSSVKEIIIIKNRQDFLIIFFFIQRKICLIQNSLLSDEKLFDKHIKYLIKINNELILVPLFIMILF